MKKKQAIIETATKLFEEHGFHAVGIDTIIAEAKVAKMTMYRHFSKKNNLIVEVLKARELMCKSSMDELVSQFEFPIEKLQAVFEWHNNWYQSDRFTGCMFAHAASEFNNGADEIKDAAANQKIKLMEFVEGILVSLVSADEAKRLSPIFIMLLDGATLSAQVMGQRNAARDAWNAAQALLSSSINSER